MRCLFFPFFFPALMCRRLYTAEGRELEETVRCDGTLFINDLLFSHRRTLYYALKNEGQITVVGNEIYYSFLLLAPERVASDVRQMA